MIDAGDRLDELYDEAPCGQLSTLPDGQIVRANRTICAWTGRSLEALLGTRFPKLLSVSGSMLYETHCAPMLRMQGHLGEVALDLLGPDDKPLPVLLWAATKVGDDGTPSLYRFIVGNATTRREYERELQAARQRAEQAAEQLRVQAELLAEHSALLMPIQDDLRVMPVIGEIDATRGRQMLRALLELDANAGVRAVILDLTGVPRIDAEAARVLLRAAAGLRLRGVRPIVTGIRPAVATTLVAEGTDLTTLAISGTLQDGIALANARHSGAR